MNPSRLKLIVGLGNPGPRFSGTRHNIGFAILDELAHRLGVIFQIKQNAEIAVYNELILVKPLTFMNNSGDAVAPFFKKGVKAEEMLVIHDELDLQLGQYKLRQAGSARGHNGIKSIIERLGTDAFWRLRCGIDRPLNKEDVPDYVLARFKPGELKNVEQLIAEACKFVLSLVTVS